MTYKKSEMKVRTNPLLTGFKFQQGIFKIKTGSTESSPSFIRRSASPPARTALLRGKIKILAFCSLKTQ